MDCTMNWQEALVAITGLIVMCRIIERALTANSCDCDSCGVEQVDDKEEEDTIG